MDDFEIYDMPQYVSKLTAIAREAESGDHLTVMVMSLDASSPEIKELFDELAKAAGRGCQLQVILDSISFMLDTEDKIGPLLRYGELRPEHLDGSFAETYAALQAVRKNGGEYCLLNQPHWSWTFPYAGRSHIKLAIFNDRLFIGGCNLAKPDNLDAMVAWRNQPTASIIEDMLAKITACGSVGQALDDTDQTFVLGDDLTLLVDSGVRNQSIIINQAYELIDNAQESLTITCQYFPGGETARRLLAAKRRGIEVRIYYSDPTAQGKLAWLQRGHNWLEQRRMPAEFFAHKLPADAPNLHAKLLVSESAAMVGSHNYVTAGVKFGTAELALLSVNRTLNDQITKHISKILSEYIPTPI